MKKSLHILADFHECLGEGKYFINKELVRTKTLRIIRRAGFKIVASRFHKFPVTESLGESGITGVVIVSESHITVHTWPERKFVNVDVFFCNYTRDNSRKARDVFKFFDTLYRPQRTRRKEVRRD
ncbi:MAG: adenosylmethionine decarboxylase [Candidatus Sungbacteria bacterium]|nr:adenosylmethionine decarboxylase [Candidatus Sungbacteria bacterium]